MTEDELAERLIRADQLIEAGDAMGELMQVQCELAGGGDRKRRIALRKREIELVRAVESRWYGTPLQVKIRGYRLGVVDSILITVDDYLRDHDVIWKLAPELRQVGLYGLRHEGASSLPASDEWMLVRDNLAPALADGRIQSLAAHDTDIYGTDETIRDVADDIVEWLVGSDRIAALRGLELSGVTPRALHCLATRPEAAHLDELVLRGQETLDSVIPDLETTQLAPRRITLEASDLEVDERLLRSAFLARATELGLPRMTSLAVGPQVRALSTRVPNDPAWLRRIADGPELAAVEELTLGIDWRATEGPIDVRGLCDAKRLDALRVLRLPDSELGLEDVRAILRSPLGQRLEVLDVTRATTEVRDVFFHFQRAAEEWDGIVDY